MELIKGFVTTLVTTLIFITAIELVGPDNSMKKYLKFVMGLILVAVLLNPIVKFFSQGETALTSIIDQYDKEIEEGISKDDTTIATQELREDSFKDNFNKNCINKLSKEFKDMTFESDLDCTVDFDNMTCQINELRIGISEKGVKKVKEVKIGEEEKEVKEEDNTQKEVKDFLSDELEISKDKIVVYYL